VRQYANLREVMTDAIQNWTADVKEGAYPNSKESYGLTAEVLAEISEFDE